MTAPGIAAVLAFIIGGCAATLTGCERHPTTDRPSAGKLRFLALGDSYTIGESVSPEQRWPVQLTALLRAEGVSIADPVIIARTGWTTAELQDGIKRADAEGPFDLVTLLIGVNNQFRGRSEDEYQREFVELLNTARTFTGGDPKRVIVLSIPDWGVTPFGRRSDPKRVGEAIDRFNAINREETVRLGARYVDVTPISRRAPQDPGLIADDGLHPSGAMYAEWARLALPEARAALAGR